MPVLCWPRLKLRFARLQAAHTELPMPSSEPIIWQFSLSTVNAIMWVALLLLALWFGFRLRWGDWSHWSRSSPSI